MLGPLAAGLATAVVPAPLVPPIAPSPYIGGQNLSLEYLPHSQQVTLIPWEPAQPHFRTQLPPPAGAFGHPLSHLPLPSAIGYWLSPAVGVPSCPSPITTKGGSYPKQGRFEKPRNRSRQRQLARFSAPAEVSANCRWRLRLLEPPWYPEAAHKNVRAIL